MTTAPTFGALGSAVSNTTGTTLNVPIPSGVVANSIVVVFIYVEGTITVPGTWTSQFFSPVVNNTSGEVHRLYILWKRASTSESGNYSFTVSSGSAYRKGRAIRYEGAIRHGDAFDANESFNLTTVDDTTTPNVVLDTTVANTLLIWTATNFDGGGDWTPPTGFSERFEADEVDTFAVLTAADKAQASVGTTGNISGSHSASAAMNVWMGNLLPVPVFNGTLVANLGGTTATAVGKVEHPGTAVANLGSLTATAIGHPRKYGTAAADLGAVTATASGMVFKSGTATASLGTTTATISGTPEHQGVCALSLGFAAEATGERTVLGVASATLGALTSSVIGTVYVVASAVLDIDFVAHGSAAGTKNGFISLILGFQATASGTSEGPVTGVATAALGGITATMTEGGNLADLITIEDLEGAIGRQPYNEEEEAAWNHYIKIVSNYINAKVRVGFQSQTVTATYQADAYGLVYLREPVTDISSVKNFRSEDEDLWVDFDGVNKLFFLEPHQVVKVTYTYGYAEVPEDIQDLAVSLVLAQIHESAPVGLRRYKVGDVEEQYNDTGFARMLDDMTKDVLDNYRRNWYSIPLTLEIFPDYQPRGFEEDFD